MALFHPGPETPLLPLSVGGGLGRRAEKDERVCVTEEEGGIEVGRERERDGASFL